MQSLRKHKYLFNETLRHTFQRVKDRPSPLTELEIAKVQAVVKQEYVSSYDIDVALDLSFICGCEPLVHFLLKANDNTQGPTSLSTEAFLAVCKQDNIHLFELSLSIIQKQSELLKFMKSGLKGTLLEGMRIAKTANYHSVYQKLFDYFSNCEDAFGASDSDDEDIKNDEHNKHEFASSDSKTQIVKMIMDKLNELVPVQHQDKFLYFLASIAHLQPERLEAVVENDLLSVQSWLDNKPVSSSYLMVAIIQGFQQIAELLVDKGASLIAPNSEPLKMLLHQDFGFFELMLNKLNQTVYQKADIKNSQDESGHLICEAEVRFAWLETLIQAFSFENKDAFINLLLQRLGEINTDDQMKLINASVEAGNLIQLISLLKRFSIDLNALDSKIQDVLFQSALISGQVQMVRHFVDHKIANLKQVVHVAQFMNSVLFDWDFKKSHHVETGYSELIIYLLKQGLVSGDNDSTLFLAAINEGMFNLIEYLVEHNRYPKGFQMNAMFSFIVNFDDARTFIYLIEKSVIPPSKYTHLFLECVSDRDIPFLEYLRKKGADINGKVLDNFETDSDSDSSTVFEYDSVSALFRAVFINSVSLVDYLLHHGAKLYESEDAAILVAVQNASTSMVRYLCEQTKLSDKLANQALRLSVHKVQFPIMRLLLTVDFKVENDYIADTIIEAIENKNVRLLRIFVFEDTFERWLDSPKFMLCLIGMMQSKDESIVEMSKALHDKWGLPWIDIDTVLSQKLNTKMNQIFAYLKLSGSGEEFEAKKSIYEHYLTKSWVPKIHDEFVDSIKDRYFDAIAKSRFLKGGRYVAPHLFRFQPTLELLRQNTEVVVTASSASVVCAASLENSIEPEVNFPSASKKVHFSIS